ncbi:MAG: hypothetical protein K1X67_04300 [Fimbriimonadaceae bacterium]|nr:hypothetical protein [Fimbriimonadaceae bacterium]
MDPFGEDRQDLTGSLISMEFGPGGRIFQLWASDPALPDEGEDFQFVLPPLSFGEENAEDLYPGTILISARTDPHQPWMSSRNAVATSLFDLDQEEGFEADRVAFDYQFPFLEDIQATGRFYEVAGVLPQIVWDLEIRNRGKKTIEIGELGFPLALNNFYDGFGWSDEQLKRLWTSRLYIHKFIGGAASWVFAQRMTAEPPGLLIFPGDGTGWELFAHIPASLNTPHQWEGIPVVYIYSRATIDREGWRGWFNEHSSLILEAGDSRTFQMRFVPTDRDKQDGVHQTLALLERPTMRVLPSAVAPIDVGIGLEVAGTSVKRFFVSREAAIETDTDDEVSFCFVKPKEPGPLRVSFEDKDGRLSHAHLMFTEPIESLIRKRAKWIVDNQVFRAENERLDAAILLTNTVTGEKVLDSEEYEGASGIECSLADALFLAEKNAHYPERAEIKILDDYVDEFLLNAIQNPGDMSVASVLATSTSMGTYSGRPLTYPDVFNLYYAMYRIAATYGETRHDAKYYLEAAASTALAMFQFGWRHYVRTVGILGYARIYDMLEDLRKEQISTFEQLERQVRSKAREMVKQQYPYAGESVLDTSGFEEVYHAALYLDDDEHLERTMRCAYAARSLAPSWWWYGSDKRSWDGADSTPLRALIDRGEACLAHTTMPNSLMFFASLDRDYLALPDAYMRLAFGGLMGPWALVRSDGAASMCFCPDLSSKHFGYNPYTGASGLGYYHYLRGAGAYVLPNRNLGVFTFGCHFNADEDSYLVRPWDGLGRRVVLRQIGAEFHTGFGRIIELRLGQDKTWVDIQIENPADKTISTEVVLKGMWGRKLMVLGQEYECLRGEAVVPVTLPANQSITLSAKVVK